MSPDPLGTALRDLVDDVRGGSRAARGRRAVGRWATSSPHRPPRPGRGRRVCRRPGHPRGVAGRRPAGLGARRARSTTTARRDSRPTPMSSPSPRPSGRRRHRASRPPSSRAPGELAADRYAVSPGGGAARVPLPRDEWGFGGPSLSPDGRWVSRGPVLTDLVSGAAVPSRADQARLEDAWTPTAEPSWWSPDSRRVFVATFNQGPRGPPVWSSASTARSPRCRSSRVEWRRSSPGGSTSASLLAFLDLGPGTSRLEGRTWRVGDDAWHVADVDVEWSTVDELEAPEDEIVRASLSPDRSRAAAHPVGRRSRAHRSAEHPRDDVRPEHRCPDRDAVDDGRRRRPPAGPREAMSSGAAGAVARRGATACRSSPTGPSVTATASRGWPAPRRGVVGLRRAVRRLRRERAAGHAGDQPRRALAGTPLDLGGADPRVRAGRPGTVGLEPTPAGRVAGTTQVAAGHLRPARLTPLEVADRGAVGFGAVGGGRHTGGSCLPPP